MDTFVQCQIIQHFLLRTQLFMPQYYKQKRLYNIIYNYKNDYSIYNIYIYYIYIVYIYYIYIVYIVIISSIVIANTLI